MRSICVSFESRIEKRRTMNCLQFGLTKMFVVPKYKWYHMLHIYAYEIDWKKYEDFISLEQEKTSADKPNRDITNNCFETKIKLYTTTWHKWINKSNEQTTIEEWKTQKSPMNHATNDKQNNNTLCRADTSTLHTRTQVLRTMSTDSQWFLLSL